MKLRRPKRAGSNELIANCTGSLFPETAPFGAFSQDHIDTIKTDERWYNDTPPRWKNATTADVACVKRAAASRRLSHPNFSKIEGADVLAFILANCSHDRRCGSAACPECGRACQRWFVNSCSKVLRTPDADCDDWSFNLVMPDGQCSISDLANLDIREILAKCRNALNANASVQFSILAVDISANDDSEKFAKGKLSHGPRQYFQAHVYGVVRAKSRDAVWKTLRPLFPRSANIFRPLHIPTTPFDGSDAGLSYILKPDGFRHIPYQTEKGDWSTRRPTALTAHQHSQYLLAMHKLGLKGRIALVGLHPERTKATKTKNRGVRLRQIYRGGLVM